MYRIILLYLFGNICFNSATLVKWLPRTNFDLPANFEDGKLPCSKRTVIFEDNIDAGITLERDVAVAGLVLPLDGEIIFGDGSINFGGPDDNCTQENLHFKMDTPYWLQADVWDSVKFNKATPDAERIPCYNDDVFIPETASAFRFPDITQHVQSLWLGDLRVNEKDITVWAAIGLEVFTHFVFNQFSSTGLVTGAGYNCTKAGCPCQEFTKIDCSVKICPKTKCSGPIKPIGNCCNICGGALTFDIDERFDLKEFNSTVSSIVESYNDDLMYHIGRLPGSKVQVVVVNKGEYNEYSVEAIYDIEAITYKHGGLRTLASISGSPDRLSGMGLKIAVSMFFLVISVMGGIYLYYYKVPEIRYPLSIPNGLLSRFNRRSDSVVSLTRRDSSVAISSSKGFRNPLYDSRRGRVQIEDEIAEHDE